MKNKMKNSNGVTLITLVITVIVLGILVSITAYEGKDAIDNTKVQSFMTDMLSIKSKVKGYSEEIDSQTWDKSGDEKENSKVELFSNYKLTLYEMTSVYNIFKDTEYADTSNYSYVYYSITDEALKNMKLGKIVDEGKSNYLVVFAKDSQGDYKSVDIIYADGVEYEDDKYYTLSELQSVFEEE